MADGKIRREDLFDESALQAINEVAEGMKKLADSFKAALKDAQQLNKEITKSQSMKELNKQTLEATKNQNQLTLVNKKFEQSLKDIEIKSQRQALATEKIAVATQKFDEAQKKATTNSNTWGKAMGSFAAKFNTIGNVVGGAILKIGSSILRTTKEFISFDKIIGATQGTADGFAAAIGALKGGFEALNMAIASGNWDNFFKNFREAAKAGREYVKALDEMGDRENAFAITKAEGDRKVAELRFKMEQVNNYSIEERKAFAEEALKIETNLLNKEVELKEKALNDILEKNRGTSKMTLDEQRKFIAGYEANLELIRKAETVIGAEAQLKVLQNMNDARGSANAAIQEQRKLIADLNAEYSKSEGFEEWLELTRKSNGLVDANRKAVTDAIVAVENAFERNSTETRRLESKYQTLITASDKLAEKSKTLAVDLLKVVDDIERGMSETDMEMEEWMSIPFQNAEDASKTMAHSVVADIWKIAEQQQLADAEAIKSAQDVARAKEEAQKLYADTFRQSLDTMYMFTENNLQKTLAAKDAELKNAGDNAAERERIEEKYAEKVKKIRRRQAIIEKVAGIFQIAVNTAKGISDAASKVATIPLIPFIAGLGIAQAIAVASQPIPQFWKGTQNAPEGLAWTGERGREMLIDQHGGMQLTPDKPTLTYLKRGTRVIPAHKTKEMIENVQVSRAPGSKGKVTNIVNNNQGSKAKQQPIININSAGITVMTQSATTLTKRIDKYFR